MAETTPPAAGLLFIGDPHLSSRRPGRRRDRDFAEVSLGKLEQALGIADGLDLVPVILGDLFDRPREDDHALLARTIRMLRATRHRAWCLVGNHDRINLQLSDDTALAVLREAGALRVIERSGPAALLDLGGRRVGLGGTPHGQEIPRNVAGTFDGPSGGAEVVVWVAHHDLDFPGAYPGAAPTFAIEGCDLVVNGHMHAPEKPLRRGGTVWWNPGNILRRSVDQLDHRPAVWSWHPGAPQTLTPHPLSFEREAFDLTGRIAMPIPAGGDGPQAGHSLFADLLKAESSAEMARTDDGSALLEDLEQIFQEEDTEPEVRAILLDLLRDAADRGRQRG